MYAYRPSHIYSDSYTHALTHTNAHMHTLAHARIGIHMHIQYTCCTHVHTKVYSHLYIYQYYNANTKVIMDCFLIGIAGCITGGSIVGAHIQGCI